MERIVPELVTFLTERGFSNPLITPPNGPQMADNEEGVQISPVYKDKPFQNAEIITSFFKERGFTIRKEPGFSKIFASKRWGPHYNVLISPGNSVNGEMFISIMHIKTAKAPTMTFDFTQTITSLRSQWSKLVSTVMQKKNIA